MRNPYSTCSALTLRTGHASYLASRRSGPDELDSWRSAPVRKDRDGERTATGDGGGQQDIDAAPVRARNGSVASALQVRGVASGAHVARSIDGRSRRNDTRTEPCRGNSRHSDAARRRKLAQRVSNQTSRDAAWAIRSHPDKVHSHQSIRLRLHQGVDPLAVFVRSGPETGNLRNWTSRRSYAYFTGGRSS